MAWLHLRNIVFFDCICNNIVFLAGSLAPRSRRQTRRQDEEKVIVFLPLKLWSRSKIKFLSLFSSVGYITQRLQRPLPCIRFRIFVSSPHLAFVCHSYFFVYFVRLLLVLDPFLLTCQLRSISVGWWGSLYLLNWCPNMYMKSSKNLYLYLICTCLLVTWEAYSSVGEYHCTCSIGTSMCTCSNAFKTVSWKAVRFSTCT